MPINLQPLTLAQLESVQPEERIVSQTQSEYVETHQSIFQSEKQLPQPPRKW